MARILIVDDDVGTVETFQQILNLAGFEAVTQQSGLAAIQMVGEEPFDLAIIDLRLTDSDGLAVLGKVSGRLPVIMISGFGDIRSTVCAMQLGAVNFLEKPIFEDELLHAVRAGLSESGHQNGSPNRYCGAHSAGIHRWARAVVGVVDSVRDPRTVEHWALLIACSAGALRIWCGAAGIHPKRSLDLARTLRAAWHAQQSGRPARGFLDATDQRTAQRLLREGGLNALCADSHFSDLLTHQTFVRDLPALKELYDTLATRSQRLAL